MTSQRETVALTGSDITYLMEEGGYLVLQSDDWHDVDLYSHPADLELGKAPPYQHKPLHPGPLPSYLDDTHLLDHPVLGGFVGRSPGISYTDRGLEIDASEPHPSGLEWLNGTPLIFDVYRGLHLRATVRHEGASDPAVYDGWVHVGFRTNAAPVTPQEAFFGVGIFGQGAGPSPFPGARTIGTIAQNSTYPQTASFDAGEGMLIAAHWKFDRATGGPERVRLTVDYWGLDGSHQETQHYDDTDPTRIQAFLDLHGQALYPAIQTYHPGVATEDSVFIVSDFCGH